MPFTSPSSITSSSHKEEPITPGQTIAERLETLTIPDSPHSRPQSLSFRRGQGSMKRPTSSIPIPPMPSSSLITMPLSTLARPLIDDHRQVIQCSPTEYIYQPIPPICESSSRSDGRSKIEYFENVLLKPAHKRLIAILQKSEANTWEFSKALGYTPPSASPGFSTTSSQTLKPSAPIIPDPLDPVRTITPPLTPRPRTTGTPSFLILSPFPASPPVSRAMKQTRRTKAESDCQRERLKEGEIQRAQHFLRRTSESCQSEPIYRWKTSSRPDRTRTPTVEGLLTSIANRPKLTTGVLRAFDRAQEPRCHLGSSMVSSTLETDEVDEKWYVHRREIKNVEVRERILDWAKDVEG